MIFHKTITVLFAFCALSLACLTHAAESVDYNLIPRPASISAQSGWATLPSVVCIKADGALAHESATLATALSALGIDSTLKSAPFTFNLSIKGGMASEGYILAVESNCVTITGGTAAGVFYGVQTFKQLLPAIVWAQRTGAKFVPPAYRADVPVSLPVVTIQDAPITGWRGMMLDSARHFMPKAFVLKLIDQLAMHKLNRLHWHLVDSEGWRLEIKKYPKLTEVCQAFPAEYPSEDPTDPTRPAKCMYGHFHGGGFYTQEDIREIVAYAKKNHIEIMPEIEFPGHAMVALTAYPEFSTTRMVPQVRSNISPDLYGVHPEAMQFLKDILDETMDLFPFHAIHFGGDESPKGQWQASAEVQALMKREGFADENQVQAWMFNQLAQHIAQRGRVAAGWEEIMHGKNIEHLTKTAIIYPWLSRANGVKSANAGHPIIHSSVGPFYMDSWQTTNPTDNWALYKGPFTLAAIYHYSLFPRGLTEEGRKNVLGAQAQMWSELLPKTEYVEYQLFPRLCALAELTWTPTNVKSYDKFYKRLLAHTSRLDAMGINYRTVDPLPVGTWAPESLLGDTITFPVELPPLAPDQPNVAITCEYKSGGYGLEVDKVELIDAQGRVLAQDFTPQSAGFKTPIIVYRLSTAKMPKNALSQSASIRITHKNDASKQDSRGIVGFYATEREADLFNIGKMKGGDYPTASWRAGDIMEGRAEVRMSMSGLVREPGEYEIIATLTNGDARVQLGNIRYQGTEGLTGNAPGTATLTPAIPRGYVPLSIAPQHVRFGNSIMVTISSPSATGGELRVRRTSTVRFKGAVVQWTPELLEKGSQVIYAQGAVAASDGVLSVTFQYLDGGCGIDIKGVQLFDAQGNLLAEDSHEGFAGANNKGNTFTFKSPAIREGVPHTLRIMMMGSGGTNSRGDIIIK